MSGNQDLTFLQRIRLFLFDRLTTSDGRTYKVDTDQQKKLSSFNSYMSAAGLVPVFASMYFLSFWPIPAYIIAWVCIGAYLIDIDS